MEQIMVSKIAIRGYVNVLTNYCLVTQERETMQDAGEVVGEKCQLLALPAELRNRIYQFALIDENAISVVDIRIIMSWYRKQLAPKVIPIPEPGLLWTCRQISVEAMQIYYSNNLFTSDYRDNLIVWLRDIGEKKSAMLKKVHIYHASFHSNPVGALCYMERDLRHLSAEGVPLKDALKSPIGHNVDQVQWCSESDIRARMSDSDWEYYRSTDE